jgi:hypothetical protein|tara:strand:- start:22 stop:225 length:204 start_codon:yes stop_codon:yes gene_type:complete
VFIFKLNDPVVLLEKPKTSFLFILPVLSMNPEKDLLTQSDFNERFGVTLKYLRIFEDMFIPDVCEII